MDEEDELAQPHIDVCYKIVEVKRCDEGEEEVCVHPVMQS